MCKLFLLIRLHVHCKSVSTKPGRFAWFNHSWYPATSCSQPIKSQFYCNTTLCQAKLSRRAGPLWESPHARSTSSTFKARQNCQWSALMSTKFPRTSNWSGSFWAWSPASPHSRKEPSWMLIYAGRCLLARAMPPRPLDSFRWTYWAPILLGRPCPYPYRGQSIVWESISRWDPQRWGRAESLVPWRAGPNTRKTSQAFS